MTQVYRQLQLPLALAERLRSIALRRRYQFMSMGEIIGVKIIGVKSRIQFQCTVSSRVKQVIIII